MRPEDFLAILALVRRESYESAEAPSVDKQTAFGFGRVAGCLQTITRIETLIQEREEQIEQAQRARENDQ